MPKMYSSIIRSRVRECIKDKHTTQKAVCKELGFSESHFCRCLRKGEIATAWIHAMAQYFDVSPEWLTNEDAVPLTHLAYQRGQNIKNRDTILSDLFILCGYDPEEYLNFPEGLKNGMITEFYPIIKYYIDMATGGQAYANRKQAESKPGELGFLQMDISAGIGMRDNEGYSVSENEYYMNRDKYDNDTAGRPTQPIKKRRKQNERKDE